MIKKLSKNLIPISIIIAGLLVAVVIIFINQQGPTEEAPEFLSSQEAARKAVDYINRTFLKEKIAASLIDVVDESGLYKMRFSIEGEEFSAYISKDGELLFPEAIDLEEASIVQGPEAEASQPSLENTIPQEELTKFINCLKEANLVVFGANWCGWTKRLVEMLGGFDMVKPIYVECTEEEELCEEKGVRAYPTILINGGEYQEARAFEEIAAATGCKIPSGAESINQGSSGDGGCQ